jgi:hypothetical protein
VGRLVGAVVATVLACVSLCGSALAAGDANRPSCSPETETSPGFRAWLPDCRAYELVSPAYGSGALGGDVRRTPPESLDGEHMLGESFGGFAETEELGQVSLEYGEIYEFARTSTGWTAEPQDPPASSYPFRILQDYGADEASRPADLGHSIWLVPDPLAPGEEREQSWLRKNNAQFVIREGRGRFATIGPAVAPGHQVSIEPKVSYVSGVSADVSHIVLTVLARDKQLWPGDPTYEGTNSEERTSLYEYHGTAGGEPVLVGVKNEGAPPWQVGATHVNEGAEPVSDCGTAYDGMSSDGERVFFSAQSLGCPASEPPVTEIYARVDGAHTVAISEPSEEDCAACNEETPEEATFAGASADGSRVFFESTQELLPGASGESLYEYDFNAPAGQRVSLLGANVTRVALVAKDGTRVYFESTSELTAAANGNGEKALPTQGNLYVYDTEEQEHGEAPLAFVADGEGASSFDATRDGQFLVFVSPLYLGVPDDSSEVGQLFEYDAASGTVVRVSVGSPGAYECPATQTLQEGYDCDGNTSNPEDTPTIVPFPGNSLAADGTVVFTSELPLTPGATQGHAVFRENGAISSYTENVYEYRQGQVYLISPGDEATPAAYEGGSKSEKLRLFGIDESGADVFFSSVDQLVTQDTDSQSSWYDAREEGGFPAPPGQPGCSGEACQGAVPMAPSLTAPPSTTATAGQNAPPPATVKPPPKTAAQVRAEKLARALKACRAKHDKRKRTSCERQARKRYGTAKKAAKAQRRRGS